MSELQIVADQNIAELHAAFSGLGNLTIVDGRKLTSADVKNADVLLVRSVTRVNAELLAGSAVKFVGSATAGIDHIDIDYLSANNIVFAYAPGCNAQAVAEYVLSSLFVLSLTHRFEFENSTIGIIGYGNAGKRLAKLLDALNISYLINDPPLQNLQQETSHAPYVELDELLQNADAISLHVPLTHSGTYSTHHLVNRYFLEKMRPSAVLINTSRGEVVESADLLRSIQQYQRLTVLDVWEDEPIIDARLLSATTLATPHIAGYSVEGKLDGTTQVYLSLCHFLERTPIWQPMHSEPLPLVLKPGFNGMVAARDTVLQVYDPRRDDAELKKLANLPSDQRATLFDRLRKEYPQRREFSAYSSNTGDIAPSTRKILQSLGFI